MKSHMKRLAVPATWNIHRKEDTFILRPRPGGQQLSLTLPLGEVLRMMHIANTLKEIKYALTNTEILVDGKRRKDHKYPVGFLGVVSIPSAARYVRLSLTEKGLLSLLEIPEKETGMKIAKISNIRKKNKEYLYSLSDGRNVLSSKRGTGTGGSILFNFHKQEILEMIPLEKGAAVFMMNGKHKGAIGIIDEIKKEALEETFLINSKSGIFTARKTSLLAVGKGKQAITVAGHSNS